MHPSSEARRPWHDICAALDPDRIDEVLMKMIDILDHPVIPVTGDRHRVEHGKVLNHLA